MYEKFCNSFQCAPLLSGMTLDALEKGKGAVETSAGRIKVQNWDTLRIRSTRRIIRDGEGRENDKLSRRLQFVDVLFEASVFAIPVGFYPRDGCSQFFFQLLNNTSGFSFIQDSDCMNTCNENLNDH